jgi:DNA (cytosine-5)-methyltransferase 1
LPRSNDPAPAFLAVDFFCGAGGTTRGLIDAGGYVAAGVDKVDHCKETFERNNVNLDGEQSRYLMRDIFRKSDSYEDGEQHILMDEIDGVLAPLKARYPGVPTLFAICAPCQPFTQLARNQLTDERSEGRQRDRDLLTQTIDFVDRFHPEMILSENVAGIQNPKYGGAWETFTKSLEDRGYIVGSRVVDTVKFGIPQSRKRSIMLAVHRDLYNGSNAIETATGTKLVVPESDGKGVVKTVWETIGHFPPLKAGESHASIPNHACSNVSALNRRRLEALQPGQPNLVYAGTDLELACHTRLRSGDKNSRTGFSDSYTRMPLDKPAPTITTKCFSFSNGRYGHPDVNQVRALSVREAAALQTFPDDYRFYANSIQKASRMVGNAVPPLLSTYFAHLLMDMTKADVAKDLAAR